MRIGEEKVRVTTTRRAGEVTQYILYTLFDLTDLSTSFHLLSFFICGHFIMSLFDVVVWSAIISLNTTTMLNSSELFSMN